MKKTCLLALLCVAVLLLAACAKEAETVPLETDAEEQLEEIAPTEDLPASEAAMPETEVFEEPPMSVTLRDWDAFEAFWNSTNLDEAAYEAYADAENFGYYSQEEVAQMKEELSGMPFPYAEDYECIGVQIVPEYEKMVIKYRAYDVCTFSYYFGRSFNEEKFQVKPETYTPVQLLSTQDVQSCYTVEEEEYTKDGYILTCYVLNVGGNQINMKIIGQPKEQAADTIANFRFGNVEDVLAEKRANPIDPTLTFASHEAYWEFLQCVYMDGLGLSGYLLDHGLAGKGIGERSDVLRISKIVQDLPIPMTDKMEISSLTIDPEAETVEVLLTAGEGSILCRLGGGVQAPTDSVSLQTQTLPAEMQSLCEQTDAEQTAAGELRYTAMVEDQPMELTAADMTREEFMHVLADLTFFNLNNPPE